MSAAKIERQVEPQINTENHLATTARALLIADLSTVEKQNVLWLTRRFGIQTQLAALLSPRDGKALGLDDTPFDRLPARRRWVTLARRALRERDPDAWRRIRAAVEWRLRGRPPGLQPPLPLVALDSNSIDEQTYAAWRRHYDALGDADRLVIQAGVATARLPELLVVIRFGAADMARLGSIVASLRAQLHDGWRALFVLDEVADPEMAAAIAALDRRIELRRGWRAGIDALPPAAYVVCAEPFVVLRPETLFAFAEAAREHPSLRLIYADEDRIDAAGQRHAPAFKPSFSPEFNRRTAYLGDCVCVAAAVLGDALDGERRVGDWAADLATLLPPAQVGRVARILFHVQDGPSPRPSRMRAAASPRAVDQTVAIIIPTRNHAALLAACVDSIWTVTDYKRAQIRIIILDNGSDEPETLALLDRFRADERMFVITDANPFNYARINNVAARAATEDVLVFLNNDTEVTEPGWLATLAGWAAQPEIGVVGPRLLYPDQTIQHGGVVLGIGGVAGHSFVGLPAAAPGYLEMAHVAREAAAVTGACIAVRRSVFEQIGGFDERLEIAFNDTALCCEAMRRGLRNLYVGDVSVLHHESKSRGFDDTPEKLARFRHECLLVRAPYKDLFDHDPCYSPNLGLERQYQPAVPRVPRIWRKYRRAIDPNPRILILSDVHAVGHGVPVVIKQHAEYLAAQGCTVFIGGRLQANEIRYAGCLRVYLDGPLEAQSFAYEADVDCVIVHTIPFFSMFRLMSDVPRRVIFDHGEPPPAWFPDDRLDRENIDAEKQFCYRIADLVLTNTATVKDEIGYPQAEVAGLGNSHLCTWDPAMALERDGLRAALGFTGKFVVLNVCRFHRAERRYKGVDDYVALRRRIAADSPALAERMIFVLCGKGSAADRVEMEAEGLAVHANVTDAELSDLYIAADLYVNFSKWEGFNLGIAQALAMGLEVIASDNPAHRQFPISTTDDEASRAQLLTEAALRPAASVRHAVLMRWEPLLHWLDQRLRTLCDM